MSYSASHSPKRARRPHWAPLFVQMVLAGGVLWNAYELHRQGERPAVPLNWPKEVLEVQLKGGSPVSQCNNVDLSLLLAKLGELATNVSKLATPGSADPTLLELHSSAKELTTLLANLIPKLPQAEQVKQLDSALKESQASLCLLLERVPIIKNGLPVNLPTFCSKR